MPQYHVGDKARLTVSFELQGGSPVDPTDVFFEVLAPEAARVLHEYAGSPADEIVNDGVGEYHIDLDLTVVGRYVYQWTAVGDGQAVVDGSFYVPGLVSLQQAKDHIRDTSAEGSAGDADLILKLDAAEATVLDYVGSTAYWRTIAATWTYGTVPPFVRMAILLQFAEFWRFRGDDLGSQGPARDVGFDLSPSVRALLNRTRDPVVI